MFKYYDRLGFMNPYYAWSDDRLVVKSQLGDILAHGDQPPRIDVSAIVEVISRYHCFADRTMVQGVCRTPWMAKPNTECTGWDFAELPPHGDRILSEEDAAAKLFHLLQREILEYCEGCSTVGILLSGGMDSRMAAGVLDYLLRTKQLSVDVVAITWGMEQTRDVLYAHQIARLLGWEWVHFPISAKTLYQNIGEAAKRGAEYSPVHLHAMPCVREIGGIDCILGASYGDSIGRAEYSGVHLTHLAPFENHTLNWFQLLRRNAYNDAVPAIAHDIVLYRALFPRAEAYQRHEVDQQAHYLRRKLNPCMSVINEQVPLLQIFTSPEVYSFVWSLSPKVRNDSLYTHLLKQLRPELSDIPWARTGKPYLAAGTPVDGFSSLYHRYGEWIRGELYDIIRDKVLSDSLARLKIFNLPAIDRALVANRKLTRQARATKLDEVSIWLAALADFVALYSVAGMAGEQSFADNFNGIVVSPLQVAGLALGKAILRRK